MRDLQRLEQLSSTAALGFWANDVVVALGHVAALEATAGDYELVRTGAAVLGEALERMDSPFSASHSARGLAATDTALLVVSDLARQQGVADDARDLLADTVAAMTEIAEGAPLDRARQEQLERAVAVFELVGERQLTRSNLLLASAEDSREWTATETTSISS